MVLEGYWDFKKADTFTRETRYDWNWVEEIEDGHRKIYVRCVGCHEIFQIGNESGTRSTPYSISMYGRVTPCLTCPNPSCGAHMFATLKGYESGKAKDVFS